MRQYCARTDLEMRITRLELEIKMKYALLQELRNQYITHDYLVKNHADPPVFKQIQTAGPINFGPGVLPCGIK